MARHHLAAALAALSLPAIAAPAAASPPAAAAAPTEPPVEPPAAPDDAARVPSPPGAACGVRVVRAPADLREQVEAQLEADGAACQGALDVWLVPASGGIYVQARDRSGRVRERLVPDAAIAATLIASWVEIDAAAPLWAPPAPADVAAPPAEVAPPSPPAPEPDPTLVAPPSQTTAAPRATAPIARPGVAASAPRRRSRVPGLSVSAMAVATGSEMSGAGVRVGVDLVRFGGFDLGLAAQASALDGSSRMFRDGDGTRQTMEHERDSGDLMATLRYTFRVGPLRLHPQVALGAGYADHIVFIFYDRIYSYEAPVTTFGARAEAALGASLGLGRRWSIEALAGTGAATYTGRSEESGDRPPVWLDGINSALIGVRFTP